MSVTYNCVLNCFSFVLRSWLAGNCAQIISMVSCKYFWQLWSVSSKFWAVSGTNYTVFHKNQETLFYRRVHNCFSFLSGSKSARKIAQT